MSDRDLRWLLDTDLPIIIEDDSWKTKRDDLLSLPRWFYEPSPEVQAVFAWLRHERDKPNVIDWEAVREHVERDFIAFFWHFCFYKERDPPRRLLLATPTPSQLVIAWRFQALVHKNLPVRMDLLKERQGGFSWEFTQIVGWLVCFKSNQEAIQVAQDKETTKKVFRYLKDLHEHLPEQFRPAHEYSSRTELVLREKPSARLKGALGLDSSVSVQTAGNDFVGTGQPVQVLHVSEIGKWDSVCDPEEVYTSVVNAIQFLPGTYIFRESTARGDGTYWHKEWKSSLKMGKPGWNGHTPIFLPWSLDARNALKAPPDMQLSTLRDHEYGSETQEQAKYGLSNDQLEWRRRNIDKQPEGRRKLDSFNQEHPPTQSEAWLNAFGKWLEPDLIDVIDRRLKVETDTGLLSPVFYGDIRPNRDLGEDLSYLRDGENENVWLRRRRAGPLTIYRLPDWHFDYIVGCDVSENVGGDSSCAKVYQRVGSPRDNGSALRLCAEWYGNADEDLLADILWRLGHFYSCGNGNNRLPALLAWERTGPGRALAKWLRKGGRDGNSSYMPSRMYRRHAPDDVRFHVDSAFGINTNGATKPVMLAAWKKAVRDGDLQLNEDDIGEAKSLVRDDRGFVDTQSRDRFMAMCMAVYASLFTTVHWGKEEKKNDEPKRDTVGWAVAHEQQRHAASRVADMIEERLLSEDDT